MSVDPSHYLPAANGGKPPLLKLQNISARPDLNGQFGQAVSFSSGRYVVALLDATTAAAAGGGSNNQPTFLKLKPENLTESGSLDQFRFGVGMLIETTKAYIAGPAVQAWGQRILAAVPPAVRSRRLTPDRALLGAAIAALALLGAAFLLVGRVVGHNKLFVVASLVAVAAAVSFPDWSAGRRARKPAGLIARGAAANFPRRWKENLVTMSGYTNISDRMALASLLAVAALSGKLLLTPTPSRPMPMPGAPMGDGAVHGVPPRARPPPRHDLEHLYKLGFDDASAGKDFGASLPEDVIEYNQEASLPAPGVRQDEAQFDWVPPPPPKAKAGPGIGTLMSLFTLYRFGKDMVTSPDGTMVFEPQYIAAKVKGMETWRLGILGMSLYRVVTALGSFFQ